MGPQQQMISPTAIQYFNSVQALYHSDEFKGAAEKKKRELIGNLIYDHIEKASNEKRAPKLCGMVIDLPMNELLDTIASLDHLEQKIKIADDLLAKAINSGTV